MVTIGSLLRSAETKSSSSQQSCTLEVKFEMADHSLMTGGRHSKSLFRPPGKELIESIEIYLG